MNILGLLIIAFLVSLFIGTKAVCLGLGITVFVLLLANFADLMGWLD